MNQNLQNIADKATKDILEKNLKVFENPNNKVILVYDLDCDLTKYIFYWYEKTLLNHPNAELINIYDIDKSDLKTKLLSLQKNDMVILLQSRNFRLEEFRIRMSLQHINVWCLEHTHLIYMKENEAETYLNAISYKSDIYEKVSNNLKNLFDNWNSLEIYSQNWSVLKALWWFEDMKKNIWVYELENRYWTLPMWENFTEIKDFSLLNWEIFIKAYPWFDFQVNFCTPFKITIEKSIITKIENAPDDFMQIIDKIKESEWEVMIRELWFWLNTAISFQNPLSDINSFERMSWLHFSLWKKHNIYRKKLHKDVVQRYHIDIFPEVEKVFIDKNLIFENGEYKKR